MERDAPPITSSALVSGKPRSLVVTAASVPLWDGLRAVPVVGRKARAFPIGGGPIPRTAAIRTIIAE